MTVSSGALDGSRAHIRLYIAETEPRSAAARAAIDGLLSRPEFRDRITLEVIDVDDPDQAARAAGVATPAVLLQIGSRTLRFVGELTAERLEELLLPAVR